MVVARSQWLRMTIDSAVLLLTKQGQPVTAEAIKSALGLALDNRSSRGRARGVAGGRRLTFAEPSPRTQVKPSKFKPLAV